MSDPHRIVISSPDVLRDFETLVPQINRRIESCLFEAVSLSFVLMACLLGKTDNIREARPYIILACPDIQRAKKSRDKIVSSGLLKTVSTPFRIDIMPSTPYGTAIDVSSPEPDLPVSLSLDSPPRSAGRKLIREDIQSQDVAILYNPSKEPPKIGLEIFVKTKSHGLCRATGNIVMHGRESEYLCLTAGHAFRITHLEKELMCWGTEYATKHLEEELMNWGTDFRFTLNEPSATSRFICLSIIGSFALCIAGIISPIAAATYATAAATYATGVLVHSVLNRSLDSRTNKWPEWERFTDQPQNIPGERFPDMKELEILGHLKHLSSDCDWAMIEVTNENLIRALAKKKDATSIVPVLNSDDSETFATVYTYDGTVFGVLIPSSICQKVSGGKIFKRVLLFQAILGDRDTSGYYKKKLPMSGMIRMGDCGSPVADSTTGKCYGHIISVSEDGKTAFVMSASDAFEAMKSEAKMGPIIWSGLEPSSRRREYSIEGDQPVPVEPNMVATAEAWMSRHNAILAKMKEPQRRPEYSLGDSDILKIAIVNFDEPTVFEEKYIKWFKMLSRLLREMAPYAIIGHSSYFFGTPDMYDEYIKMNKAVWDGSLSREEYSERFETIKRRKAMGQQKLLKHEMHFKFTIDEFEPDIIVMVRVSKQDQWKRATLAIEYAEKKGILLLAAPSSEDPSPTSEVLEMIRVYSADGDGHSHSRYTGVEGHEHGIMTLGECVRSIYRPTIERWGPDATIGRLMSGDSCAAVVAAGIAAMILEQARSFLTKDEWYHLRRTGTMYALLRSMGELDEEIKSYWIKHWEWFGPERTSLDFEKEVRLVLQKNPPVQRPPAKD